MSLFVPACPRWTEPNQRAAATPYELRAGGTISLEERLFGLGTSDITQAVPLWYAEYGLPEPPPMTKSLEETYNDLMRGWAETCYCPEADAFVNHWRMGQTPSAAPSLKAHLLAHARVTGERAWVERCKIAPDAKLHRILGPLTEAVKPGPPPASVAEQRADGTWVYHCTESVRKMCEQFTGGERHSLGEEGSTCVGLCAVQAAGVLAHALQTGNPESERAGLRALDAMWRFRVPRGSQTWEVHKDIPDIYAAALATDCFRMGWQLTGERRYLDAALYWARSGLPFLYSYQVPGTGPGATCTVPGDPRTPGPDPFEGSHPAGDVYRNPDRQVTPWGSIPVFGTSFYVVSWYGVLVQWCGLVWADSVYALPEHADDPILRAAADGVLASGCNQTFDIPPVVGLLPDSWNLAASMINPAFIGPVRVQAPLERRLGWVNGVDTHTCVARAVDLRAHVTSRGRLSDLSLSRGSLRWTERYIAGESCDTVVLGLPAAMAPTSVRVDGREVAALAPGAEADATEGWQHGAETGSLFVRAAHAGAEARVEVLY
jgi:hypothetical protein